MEICKRSKTNRILMHTCFNNGIGYLIRKRKERTNGFTKIRYWNGKQKRRMSTWSFLRLCSASARWARLATMRKRRRGFLTTETADLHRRRAASEGFFGWTLKFSRRYFSIAIHWSLSFLHSQSLSSFTILATIFIWLKKNERRKR